MSRVQSAGQLPIKVCGPERKVPLLLKLTSDLTPRISSYAPTSGALSLVLPYESTVSEVAMPMRRSHAKSRLGCHQCKVRRVKVSAAATVTHTYLFEAGCSAVLFGSTYYCTTTVLYYSVALSPVGVDLTSTVGPTSYLIHACPYTHGSCHQYRCFMAGRPNALIADKVLFSATSNPHPAPAVSNEARNALFSPRLPSKIRQSFRVMAHLMTVP
jgi:hypothetical protein